MVPLKNSVHTDTHTQRGWTRTENLTELSKSAPSGNENTGAGEQQELRRLAAKEGLPWHERAKAQFALAK